MIVIYGHRLMQARQNEWSYNAICECQTATSEFLRYTSGDQIASFRALPGSNGNSPVTIEGSQDNVEAV